MKKGPIAFLMVLALTVMGLPALAWASDEPAVKVDVAAANGDYGDYIIDDTSVAIVKADTVYELSGSTDKAVFVDNSGSLEDGRFQLRLGNATLSGGITARNNGTFRLKLEVPAGTVNYVDHLSPLCLDIFGAGALDVECINAGSTNADGSLVAGSSLFIEDAQVKVMRNAAAQDSCHWKGGATLSGNANVTIVSSGDYAPLRATGAEERATALTIKGNARLSCLHSNPEQPSKDYVDGLQVGLGKLVVQDHGYLEAEGRPLEGSPDEGGCGVFSGGDIEIKDSAHVVTNAVGWSLSSENDVIIPGPGVLVEARSTGAYGIYVESRILASSGARIEASGALSALFSESSIDVDGVTLIAKSEVNEPISAEDTITIKNGFVDAGGSQDCGIFSAGGSDDDSKITVDNSWIMVPASNKVNGTITNSVVFVGDRGTVVGNVKTPGDAEVAVGQSLVIPADASLTVASGTTLTNNGSIEVLGILNVADGTLVRNSHAGGVATCVSKAVCSACGAEYGELEPSNHAHGLAYVEAKDATATTEGNKAYWYCPDCEKCFSDEAGAIEITKASIVVPKLASEQEPAGQTAAAETSVARSLAATGDASPVLALAAAFLGVVTLAGAVVACKRR